MAPGRAARARARRDQGGAAVRARGPHLGALTGAGLAAGLAAAYPPLLAGRFAELVAVAGGAGAALLVLGALLGVDAAIAPGAGAVGCAYAAALVAQGGGPDPLAPAEAALLVLAAELAYLALRLRRVDVCERAALVRLAVRALAAAAGGGAAAALVLVAAAPAAPGGLLVEAAGALAAVAAIALLARLARRAAIHGGGRPPP